MITQMCKRIKNETHGNGLNYAYDFKVVNNRLRIKTYWQVMNDMGYYVGPTPVTVWIDLNTNEIEVRCANTGICQDLADHIYARFSAAVEMINSL